MKILFYGAAQFVTGSCYCVECGGKRILIDCGLQQGRDETEDNSLPFLPNSIDYVFVTHAHIDHSGRIPLLVKTGYSGPIFTTGLTAQLLAIMLKDSAYIQEREVEWQNQKGKRAGREPVEPLYTVADAEAALTQIKTYEYGQKINLSEGITFQLTDPGHILGSASVELWLTEGGETRSILFSGDLGNVDKPVIRDPQQGGNADYVVMESTYGDRNHEPEKNHTQELAQIFNETFARGGNVIIPSFAVGRTQDLLYFIREIKEKRLIKSFPEFSVYVDSPLAKAATHIYSGNLTGYLDEEAQQLVREGEEMFEFPGLRLVETNEESRALNDDPIPKVIISASGMCDAGRIRHHLKHNLWRPECTVLFVGYQAEGTLGRRLIEGVDEVKLFGEEISVRAQIVNMKGLSSHADQDHLLAWAESFSPAPVHIFVTHGESEVALKFAALLSKKGLSAHAPEYMETYDLIENRLLTPGVARPPVVKEEMEQPEVSLYTELYKMGTRVTDMIRRSKNRSNNDLRKIIRLLESMLDKWDR